LVEHLIRHYVKGINRDTLKQQLINLKERDELKYSCPEFEFVVTYSGLKANSLIFSQKGRVTLKDLLPIRYYMVKIILLK